MQPYSANHHFSYFQCRCHPKTTPSLNYPQAYEPQFPTQLPVKKPFKSPFSIESLLGGESHELSVFSSPSTKKATSTSVAAKLKELEDRRRNNSTSVPHSSRDKKASTSTEIQTSHRGKSSKSIDHFLGRTQLLFASRIIRHSLYRKGVLVLHYTWQTADFLRNFIKRSICFCDVC